MVTHNTHRRGAELSRLEGENSRLLGEVRVLVAIATMVAALLDSAKPWPDPALAVLFPYGAFCAAAMLLAKRGSDRFARMHLVDAGCYLFAALVSSGQTNQIAVALLFPILVVSFHSGFRRGAVMAAGCAGLLAVVDAAQSWLGRAPGFGAESLLPAAALFLVGLVVARWGNSEFTLLRRLAFLNDLNSLATPRYGLPQAMSGLAEMLRAYLRADSCIIVMNDAESVGYSLFEARAGSATAAMRREHMDREVAAPLIEIDAMTAAIYGVSGMPGRPVARAYERTSLKPIACDRAQLDALARLLEAESYVTLPLFSRGRPIGRIYASSLRFNFTKDDLGFLQQAVGHAALVIDTILLAEQLANDKAREARERISRDLHDGTIQPYIGLKLGLEALRRQMADDDALASEVDDLKHMAEEGVAELRRYVAGLRGNGSKASRESLLVAVKRQADRFSEYYGIQVHVSAENDMQLKEPLFEHVMHIVREGLANIRRHTAATRATVRLLQDEGRLLVEILNDRAAGCVPSFFPRSLNERATDLGGRVSVDTQREGCTRVAVEIPI